MERVITELAVSRLLSISLMQDKNARYYRYKYITDEHEAMSYWVDHDQHSTVFDNHYRKAIVSLLYTRSRVL